ncbi:hypothetical protein [Sphingobacterium corticibacterium]|uniref:DUF4836 family protein n=1 Tax=Sphingobacterium corticibacterium TaxID=2484746 RepID=A0A4Q6XP47_9SPHI|nr:hypothetical protein [Sphingobacterium corticibacterium]RZF61960.1 hypothetical protein EWE74_03855 [Sphingobacterium corticibacterium]
MKFQKSYIATLVGLSIAATSYGQQDLIQQVPENASFVVVINNQAIVKHSSFEKINEVLEKLGAFDDIGNQDVPIERIHDLDLSYDRSAYIYKSDTDSSYYTGILLPLKAGHQIGTNLFSKLSPFPASQGYERRVSTDGKTQVAWNDHSVLILTGDARRYYFDTDSVAQRYGIDLPTYDKANTWLDYPYDVVPDTANVEDMADAAADAAYTITDTVERAWQAYDFEVDTAYLVDTIPDNLHIDFPPPALETEETHVYSDYPVYDTYSDSTYQKEMARNAKNDSLRNAAFASWLAQDFDRYLHPAQNATSHKFLNKFDKKNTLVHFWSRNMMSLYSQSIPYYMPTMQYAFVNQMEKLAYGYQDIVLNLVQDKHTLKLQGSFGLDKEMERMIKPIYKNKMNRKFARYIPEKHIGYMSLNFNSEAYLKNFPLMMEQLYGSTMYFSFGEVAGIVATALEIALDEKAIANVMGGDHVLFINEMKKVEKEYIDYQYDENTFDYKEIKKTKDDYIPTFLWMFTSADQRIYKKILKLGESKEKVTQTEGIYRIADKPSDEIIYALFKDNMVFVSNDEEQLSAIRTNRFPASRDKHIKKQIFSNTMTAVTHLSEIPETINRLGIPVIKRWDHLVNNLSAYGDVTITAQGNKKGRITGEMAVDFPQQETNALQYLLQELLKTIDK